MDGEDGKDHPILGAAIAGVCLGPEYTPLVLLHSRHLAREWKKEPSKLCYADKLSIKYEPPWFYLLRARLSGELAEYKANAKKHLGFDRSDKEWFAWVRPHLMKVALEQRGDAAPYSYEERANG